jgi:hypothetical protein
MAPRGSDLPRDRRVVVPNPTTTVYGSVDNLTSIGLLLAMRSDLQVVATLPRWSGTQLRAGALLADERDEALVVFGASWTVA